MAAVVPEAESGTTAPAEPASPFDFAAADHSPSARARRSAAEDNNGGTFGPEKQGLKAGVVGGILMMLLAVVWFVGGLAAGILFYYPPILFIIGVVGVIKGLIDGNLSGNRRRRY